MSDKVLSADFAGTFGADRLAPEADVGERLPDVCMDLSLNPDSLTPTPPMNVSCQIGAWIVRHEGVALPGPDAGCSSALIPLNRDR